MLLRTWSYLYDVEEWQGGWIVGDGEHLIAVAKFDFRPVALATVPGLGFAVRNCTRVQFLAIAMASMSLCKVAWMAAVACGRRFLT